MSAQTMASSATPTLKPPQLLDQVRGLALTRFGGLEPGERHVVWARRYILYHGKRHPRELGNGKIGQFLEFLAQSEKDSLRALEQGKKRSASPSISQGATAAG